MSKENSKQANPSGAPFRERHLARYALLPDICSREKGCMSGALHIRPNDVCNFQDTRYGMSLNLFRLVYCRIAGLTDSSNTKELLIIVIYYKTTAWH